MNIELHPDIAKLIFQQELAKLNMIECEDGHIGIIINETDTTVTIITSTEDTKWRKYKIVI